MPAGGGGRGGGGETPSFNFTGATFYRAHTRGKPKDTEGAANRQGGIFYTKTLFAVQYQSVAAGNFFSWGGALNLPNQIEELETPEHKH